MNTRNKRASKIFLSQLQHSHTHSDRAVSQQIESPYLRNLPPEAVLYGVDMRSLALRLNTNEATHSQLLKTPIPHNITVVHGRRIQPHAMPYLYAQESFCTTLQPCTSTHLSHHNALGAGNRLLLVTTSHSQLPKTSPRGSEKPHDKQSYAYQEP